MDAPTSHLSVLNSDVRFKIIQNLSRAPRSKRWRYHMPVSSIIMLIHARSPFLQDFPIAFPGIAVTIGSHTGIEELSMSAETVTNLDILQVIGQSIEKIAILDSYRPQRAPILFFQNVSKYCTHIRQLELHTAGFCSDKWSNIVKSVAGTLENLKLGPILSDPKELLCDVEFPHLKSLDVCIGTSMDPRLLFKPFGSNVNQLGLFVQNEDSAAVLNIAKWEEILETVRKYCPNVRAIKKINSDVPALRYYQLLASYGFQLRHADLHPFETEPLLCAQVIQSYPNVTGFLNLTTESLKSFYVLAPHIEQLKLGEVDYFDYLQFGDAVIRCTKLTKLVVDCLLGSRHLFKMFSTLNIHHIVLHERRTPSSFSDLGNSRFLTEAQNTLSDFIGETQILEISGSSFYDKRLFELLAKGEKLVKIKLNYKILQDSKKEKAIKFVQNVLQAAKILKQIQHIFIRCLPTDCLKNDCVNATADVAQMFRLKSTYIEVNGVDILSS